MRMISLKIFEGYFYFPKNKKTGDCPLIARYPYNLISMPSVFPKSGFDK